MKIIFLDHQGVMYTEKHPHPGTLEPFNPECIKILNSILEIDPDIQIVVSSDWKYWASLKEMQKFYKRNGVLRSPIDYTPKSKVYTRDRIHIERAMEIKQWLENNTHVHNWLALDDLDMRDHLMNFIWINHPEIGICQHEAEEYIKFLL